MRVPGRMDGTGRKTWKGQGRSEAASPREIAEDRRLLRPTARAAPGGSAGAAGRYQRDLARDLQSPRISSRCSRRLRQRPEPVRRMFSGVFGFDGEFIHMSPASPDAGKDAGWIPRAYPYDPAAVVSPARAVLTRNRLIADVRETRSNITDEVARDGVYRERPWRADAARRRPIGAITCRREPGPFPDGRSNCCRLSPTRR